MWVVEIQNNVVKAVSELCVWLIQCCTLYFTKHVVKSNSRNNTFLYHNIWVIDSTASASATWTYTACIFVYCSRCTYIFTIFSFAFPVFLTPFLIHISHHFTFMISKYKCMMTSNSLTYFMSKKAAILDYAN